MKTSDYPGLTRKSEAARFLGLRVRIPPGAWMSVTCKVNVVCRQVEASANVVCLCLIVKTQKWVAWDRVRL